MYANAVQRIVCANPVDNPAAQLLIEDLIENGHARLRIDPTLRRQLDHTFQVSRGFYARPRSEKFAYADTAFVEGYREIGLEYSWRPDRPDLTESFSVWNRNRARTEAAGWPQTCALHAELRNTTDALSPLIADLFQAMADRWAPGTKGPRFYNASYIQVNYYEPAQHSRDMLQDGHEDGHLITAVTATGPGLEMKVDGEYVPVELEADEMLLMPGSLLTLMTGGAIQPLFHQVKNSHRRDSRYSMMFFVNPESKQTLEPWIRNETNAGIDIVAEADKQPLKFGLPTLVDGTSGNG